MVNVSTNTKINHLVPQTFDTNVPCQVYMSAQNTMGLSTPSGMYVGM
jgi:hypothetical protein